MVTGSSPRIGLYPPFPLTSAPKVAAWGLLSGGSVSSSSVSTMEVMERLGGIGWVRMVAGALVSVLISALT